MGRQASLRCMHAGAGTQGRAALKPLAVPLQGNERLLKLYESGLPAWAIYAPQYGRAGARLLAKHALQPGAWLECGQSCWLRGIFALLRLELWCLRPLRRPPAGLFYRPWLRTLTWVLFYAFSVFSFVMGCEPPPRLRHWLPAALQRGLRRACVHAAARVCPPLIVPLEPNCPTPTPGAVWDLYKAVPGLQVRRCCLLCGCICGKCGGW